MIKKRILIILCLIMLLTNITEVKADDPLGRPLLDPDVSNEGSGNDGQGNGNGGGQGGNNNLTWSQYPYPVNGKKRYEYQASIKVTSGLKYTAWGYNFNGFGKPIKAGTWIGLSVNEIQWATWTASVGSFREIKKKYKCTYTLRRWGITGQKCEYKGQKTCLDTYGWISYPYEDSSFPLKDYYENFECPIIGGANGTKSYEEVRQSPVSGFPGDSAIKNAVYSKAYSSAKSAVGAPLSKLQITTEELDSDNKYKLKIIGATLVAEEDTGLGPSGRVSKTYGYSPRKICINLKTGKVSYITNEDYRECKADEEAEVKKIEYNGLSYWQYFSPLDMKSGSTFNLAILNNSMRKLSAAECHSFMNKYKATYPNYIITLKNASLKGDYCKNGNCNNLNKGAGSDWQAVSNGCYFSTRVSFDVEQKYYYEEKKNNELIFNGYNFYYRPININNPFPNVPTRNSLWYEWYNSNNKSLNLEDSFKEITYSVDVSNKLADTIRAYNLNNPYPSFDKLSLKGKSSFLQSIEVEALTKDKSYSLGGGTKTCVKNGTVSIGSDCS